ncbi:preprotein translocase subunit YajC [Halomonas elongata]|uniref:Sec translocon accessory complex subunit YajC n=2 Tax=Halomonas elongata TaxID=2746 RepID=E1V6F5_HALED|nr:preprotein translocase subunit YajC [Halomonas elongata]MBW5800894.1 preprotein translocase subunit YajC [Halomonas elongata]MDL4861801.1 preprotein translocase subunit YajC [Halomonas elongata]OBX37981.1 preprotein translocase subunit YajC [Halomonas elongata]RAW07583.1 preprotein translocase subunit YajC [Halomonas elongata]WBF18522.1 preprotein translocase subunit YajC [Halomonas elongata]
MLDFFISPALAQDAGGAPGGGIAQIVMLVGFVLIFYFLLWRPQAKRAKQHKKLISGLSKGDEIVIGGGMLGRITKVSEDSEFLTMEIAEGTEVNVQKNAVATVLPKGTLKSI